MNDKFGDLVPFETDEEIYYKKGEDVMLEYDKKNRKVFVDYDNIWSFFKSYFNMSHEQIQHLTKKWIKERYKLKVSTITNSWW